MALPEFSEFDKIARLNRQCVITEKIDGTNASIFIPGPDDAPIVTSYGMTAPLLAGSRSAWIWPENDNFGFARWAFERKDDLLGLGPGHHFGEWWGSGIQRRYGLNEKRFSLFNTGRWIESEDKRVNEKQQIVPACCRVVPVLAVGVFSTDLVVRTLEGLSTVGSQAAPGFMKPEGVVIYHEAARTSFKVTIEKDTEPKGKQQH